MSEKHPVKEQQLFEELSVFLESTCKYSPLTAKIQSYMILRSDHEGFTFEELLDVFKVSKSSLSTSINLLISTNQVQYINKIDSRKRYFKLNPNYIPDRFTAINEMLLKEYNFTKQIRKHRAEHEIDGDMLDPRIVDVYLDHLQKARELMQETIDKINTIQLEN